MRDSRFPELAGMILPPGIPLNDLFLHEVKELENAMMKRSCLVSVLGLAAMLLLLAAAEPPYSIYVQFIRANNNAEPEDASWKEVGPKLSSKLSPVLRWEHFWEANRLRVELGVGSERRIEVAPQREVRLRLLPDIRLVVRYFWKGEMKRRIVRDMDDKLSIIEGNFEDGNGWFIVVRRDKPTLE